MVNIFKSRYINPRQMYILQTIYIRKVAEEVHEEKRNYGES